MIKAVIFDIGQTLVLYHNPLNWKSLYRPALEQVAEQCGYQLWEEDYGRAIEVLIRYNTRENPREYEVSSNTIFEEILNAWKVDWKGLEYAKDAFYTFFRNEARPFPEAKNTLIQLKKRGIHTAALSDVAYGMDNQYALSDIAELAEYIDLPLTSNDIGYRKPNVQGLVYISERLGVRLNEMIYVGDEEKDVMCANRAGACSVLVNRSDETKNYNQNYTIRTLNEILKLMDGEG